MKKRNEEVPDNLGGLGELLPAEVLKLVNELLEHAHQSDHQNKGSNNTFIYVASGAQYVNNLYQQTSFTDHPQMKTADAGGLPDALATEEAMVLWQKAQDAGYVDDNYQPLISRTQSALLADAMAKRLGIKEKWKVFEMFWHRKNMYRDYYKALNLQQSFAFMNEIKSILS